MFEDLEKATKSGVPALWLFEFLEQKGLHRSQICSELNLNQRLIHSRRPVLPVELFDLIFEWSSQKLNNDSLGLHIAKVSTSADFGVLGYLERNIGSIKYLCQMLEKYHRVFSPEFSLKLHKINDHYFFEYIGAKIDGSHSKQDIDFTIALTVASFRDRIDEEWNPIHCQFSYPEPRDTGELEKFFGCELSFNQVSSGVTFDAAIAEKKLAGADQRLLQILIRYIDNLLDKVDSKDDIVRHIRLLISTNLSTDNVTTEFIADKLHVSVRNLHNRLRKKNTSFKEIKEDVILHLSKEALANTETTVTQISHKMGYSESSAFIRMFKRIVGVSPLQYRKQLGIV